jgi:hypothetical protein
LQALEARARRKLARKEEHEQAVARMSAAVGGMAAAKSPALGARAGRGLVKKPAGGVGRL